MGSQNIYGLLTSYYISRKTYECSPNVATMSLKEKLQFRPGGGNIRPAGHIRPARANFFSFDFASLTEMWPARH